MTTINFKMRCQFFVLFISAKRPTKAQCRLASLKIKVDNAEHVKHFAHRATWPGCEQGISITQVPSTQV